MGIPTRARCLELMEQVGMPAHIRQHSLAVARVACGLARALVGRGVGLDLGLVEASSLLHDIGKARALGAHQDHAKLGAEMVSELGFPELAPIVKAHVGLSSYDGQEPLTETLIVNYADKRVMHQVVVDLETRFADLADRYATNDRSRALLSGMLDIYRGLEAEIFRDLPFGPDDVDHVFDET